MLCEVKICTPEWTEEKDNNLITQFKFELNRYKTEMHIDMGVIQQ